MADGVGVEVTFVEHDSSEEAGDHEADYTDSDGREPSSNPEEQNDNFFWCFSV